MKVAANSKKVKKVSYVGSKRCLIILAQFANKKFSMDDPRAFYNRVANEEGFSEGSFRGSVKDYFRDQSNGQFNLTFDVVGPYTLSNYENYGGNDAKGSDKNPRGMVSAVCQNAADEGIDFSPYDWDGDGEVEWCLLFMPDVEKHLEEMPIPSGLISLTLIIRLLMVEKGLCLCLFQ